MRLRNGVVMTETDYGAVLLDEKSGEYWTLNQTGAVIASTLLGGGGYDDAVLALTGEYDIDADSASADVSELVEHLRSQRLVRAEPGGRGRG